MQNIEEKITQLNLNDCKADISSIDCQESLEQGVMVMVIGTLMNADNRPRRFSQPFFLAVQPNGYYVLNDIFRYLSEADAEAAPAAAQFSAGEHHFEAMSSELGSICAWTAGSGTPNGIADPVAAPVVEAEFVPEQPVATPAVPPASNGTELQEEQPPAVEVSL